MTSELNFKIKRKNETQNHDKCKIMEKKKISFAI
ncbi:hypothetical protein P872_03125 [Rhodonellum psychrophilum GCM71 = DSM 17998]|uniref:Uncharacterized protein n=1 Tax=Rhodonellum psychrophilum GCM71 = DSM 17998 TaxID=1123057 RepID=U5C3Y0_9BACT|nr:hypothetical protein P872_03125 [Rhodonellum psychrophilum GCM71 = DSM 17998]